MTRIIVTDLTKFSNRQDVVCVAGIDMETDECIRPLPYLAAGRCAELGMRPGSILKAVFSHVRDASAPHIEDRFYDGLSFQGNCVAVDFESLLQESAYPSMDEAFAITLEPGHKNVGRELSPIRSLVTLSVQPRSVRIIQDTYQPAKLKVHFADVEGRQHSFLPITDAFLIDYVAASSDVPGTIANLNARIHGQSSAYFRIGLSRHFEAQNGASGYWMQVNGIHCYPEALISMEKEGSQV